MSRSYWETVSKNYEEEVQSVFRHDTEGMVRRRIAAAGSSMPEGRSADLGCGVGMFTPLLARAFKSVEACDWAEAGLAKAQTRCKDNPNTNFSRLDFSQDVFPFEPVDFAICINVLIMPSFDERMRAWRAITNQIKAGGSLLLVVPSHESAQMEIYRDIEARLDIGDTCEEALSASQPKNALAADLQQGVYSCNGTRTKYYLIDELKMLLAGLEFEVVEAERIVYPGGGEGGSPESWDWLVVAKRRRSR